MDLEEAKAALCAITKEDLKLCNDISGYCDNYSIEYGEEIRELEDLLLYFKGFVEKI